MSKEQKPTLGSGAIRTRKRNIQTKSDPEAFRTRILELIEQADGERKKQLSLLDNDSLEYQRYGEVFAEIMLAGNIVEPGGSVRDTPCAFSVFQASGEEEVTTVIDLFHQLMRRKPFLRTRLDTVMEKLLLCGSVFEQKQAENLAYATSLLLHRNMLTIGVLHKLSTRASVDSGFSFKFLLNTMKAFLAGSNGEIDKLLHLLKHAKLDQDTVLELMPAKTRSSETLNEELEKHGLGKLVEQFQKRQKAAKLSELTDGVRDQIAEETPPDEIYDWVMRNTEDGQFSSVEVISILWDGIVKQVNMTRKAHQARKDMLSALDKYSPMLLKIAQTGQDELNLVVLLRDFISADMELLKSGAFRDVVVLLYEKDVLSEDTIHMWYRMGSTLNKGSAASSNIIREQMAPFMKWLETADEESDDEE